MTQYNTLVELFSDPARHTRGWYWKNAEGKDCAQADATCFCLLGGLVQVYLDPIGSGTKEKSEARAAKQKEITDKLSAVIQDRHPGKFLRPDDYDEFVSLPAFNDTVGYEEVLETCKLAGV